MPKKKTSIICRRPHRSPRRPAGTEHRPNSMNAPIPYGISVSQSGSPNPRRSPPPRGEDQQEHVVERVRDVEQHGRGAGKLPGHGRARAGVTRRVAQLRVERRRDLDAVARALAASALRRVPGQADAGVAVIVRDAPRCGRGRRRGPRRRRDRWTRNVADAGGLAVVDEEASSASKPNLAPVQRGRPAAPPSGPASRPWRRPSAASMPLSPALGSVVGLPSASTAQSGGIGSPFCTAVTILAARHLRSDRSMTTGACPAAGAAAIGLVPYTERLPPHGAMAFGVLPKANATSPASARRSTWRPTTPK